MKMKSSPSLWPALHYVALLVAVALVLPQPLLGQQPDEPRPLTRLENNLADGVYRPVELGPHHRVMQRIAEVPDESGSLQPRTNSYVELGNAMHVWSQAEQKWLPADDEIEILEDRAVARKSQHQVTFAGNLNDPNGTVDLLTPDGKRLRTRVMGLAYTEADTGKSAFIAETKDTQGFVVGRNQVTYLDAFDSVKADLRYTTRRSLFEADVILREKLPDPTEFGLRPEATRLEVWTAILNEDVQPEVKPLQREGPNGQENDIVLDFGVMQIGPGKAFDLDDPDAGHPLDFHHDAIDVSKEMAVADGQRFLIESVSYAEAKPQIDALPPPQAKLRIDPQQRERVVARAGPQARALPVRLVDKEIRPSQPKRLLMAKVPLASRQRGFAIDWVGVNTATNFTFKGDTTYYVMNEVYLSQTTIIEGGTVIKYARDNPPSNYVWVMAFGPIICKTSAFRPALLTAVDDHTVGEVIGSGTLTGTYGRYALIAYNVGTPVELSYLRFLHQYVGLELSYNSGHQVKHCQFVNCANGVLANYTGASVRNTLFHQADTTALNCINSALTGEHLTVNVVNKVFWNQSASTLLLTNCLLAAITTPTSDYTNHHGVNLSSGSGVFQTVGAGAHYLAANSPYRNYPQASPNINAQLAADLKTKTTYAPVLLVNNITASSTTLAPVVQRDTDALDLGYHYESLDYLLSEVTLSNATLLLTNGVAIGTYGSRGIYLGAGAKLVSEGTPTSPNRLGHVRRVQESLSLVNGGVNQAWLAFSSSGPPKPELRLIYSDLSVFGTFYDRHLGVSATYYSSGEIYLSDCYLRGAFVDFYNPNANGLNVTMRNNFCERINFNHTQDNATYQNFPLNVYNNVFLGGFLYYNYGHSGTTWNVKDNYFDSEQLNRSGSTFSAANNGYKSGLAPFSNDPWPKTIAVSDFQNGAMNVHLGYLGNHYYPTTGTNLAALRSWGSRYADAAGLWHHTLTVDQIKDTGWVDVGFHYVALNGSNLPVDTDSDGKPDYAEDKDGDGVFDSGETDWQTSNSSVSGPTALQVFTLLK